LRNVKFKTYYVELWENFPPPKLGETFSSTFQIEKMVDVLGMLGKPWKPSCIP
jgi:hypothetical protein